MGKVGEEKDKSSERSKHLLEVDLISKGGAGEWVGSHLGRCSLHIQIKESGIKKHDKCDTISLARFTWAGSQMGGLPLYRQKTDDVNGSKNFLWR